MKNLFVSSIVLAAISMTISCEKEDWNDNTRVSGEGEIVIQQLSLEPYSEIILDGVANLYITVGMEESTTLKAQQNIIDVLRWKVSSGTLIVGLKEGITLHNHEEIKFELNVQVLNKLIHEGVGDVSFKGTSQDDLDIDFRGVGNVFAYGLTVNNCVVLNSGTGDCKVQANKTLDVDIASLGNVYYRGNPEISLTDSGPGELINDN